MEKGQESKQKRKTPLTTIAISQEYAQKLDEYLNGTGITRKEFVELSVVYVYVISLVFHAFTIALIF